MFTITEDKIRTDFFKLELDRDNAFDEFVLPRSSNCIKGKSEDD